MRETRGHTGRQKQAHLKGWSGRASLMKSLWHLSWDGKRERTSCENTTYPEKALHPGLMDSHDTRWATYVLSTTTNRDLFNPRNIRRKVLGFSSTDEETGAQRVTWLAQGQQSWPGLISPKAQVLPWGLCAILWTTLSTLPSLVLAKSHHPPNLEVTSFRKPSLSWRLV